MSIDIIIKEDKYVKGLISQNLVFFQDVRPKGTDTESSLAIE